MAKNGKRAVWRAGLLSVALGGVGVAWAQTVPPASPSSPTISNPDAPNLPGGAGQLPGQVDQPGTPLGAQQPEQMEEDAEDDNVGSTTPDPSSPVTPQAVSPSVVQPLNSADRATGALPAPTQNNVIRSNPGVIPSDQPLEMNDGMGGSADAGY